MRLLSSPRRRRRLAWAGGILVALATAAGVVSLLPEGKPLPPDNFRPGPVVKEEREVRLTRAVRREINATLDRFVPAALTRRNPDVAWKLAAPGLRIGTTRDDWARGDIPVHPYPFRPQPLHGWQLVYAYRDRVALDLLVMPRKEARVGPIVFGVDLVRHGRRWLVNSMYPSAIFSGPDERPWVTGPADFQAGAATPESFYSKELDRARLSAAWLAVPGALFALLLLVPIGLVARGVLRDRRARAEYNALKSGR